MGDFNGDGYCDIITRSQTTGDLTIYLLNSGNIVSSTVVLPNSGNWRAAAVCDLNGDGKADIVLRNIANGWILGWIMDGTTVADSAVIYSGGDTSWSIACSGDLDGDGKSDLVLVSAAARSSAGSWTASR